MNDTDRNDGGPVEGPEDNLLAFLKDNFEAIAVAVIMALVIKHFCVEAFKIPTSSMMPTLQGEHDNDEGEGDRILVDKFAYLFSDPARWDVIVFRYPLNRARNFIKRIGGLPGEHLRISSDGDLWVRPGGSETGPADLRIPQKPRRVREQFYRPVYPPPDRGAQDAEAAAEDLRRLWRGDEASPNRWRVEAADRFEFAGGAAAELRAARNILDHTSPGSWAHGSDAGVMVRDARFRARIRLPAPAGADAPAGEEKKAPESPVPAVPTRVSFSWRADDEYLAVLALSTEAGGSKAFIRRFRDTVEEQALDVVLTPGAETDVELEYVDGTLRAHVGGKELAILLDGRRWEDTSGRSNEQAFVIKADGGPLSVEDLRVDRDMRYINNWDAHPVAERDGVTVPDDSYFMLGDNTGNSSDSRKWRMVRVRMKDGSEILHEAGEADYIKGVEGSWMKVVDADGILRRWNEADEESSKTFNAPFVRRDLVVGRAFLVFWPCFPDFPGRLGFIH